LPDTIPADTSTAANITVGSTTNGTLDYVGDHDWYKIILTAGQAITVTVNGATLDDPYLNIRDSSGIILYSNDDIIDGTNRNSQISFSASYSGTYYVDVGAYNDSLSGTYQVAVQPYTSPPVATTDQIANQLTSGYWAGDVHHWAVSQGGTITVNISTLNAAEQNLARNALQEWSDIIGVTFKAVTTGGQIVFDDSEQSGGTPTAATDANWSNGIITSAHVHISSSWVNNYGTSFYSYSFQTYIHEIGHALGLGHAGDYNNTASYPYEALFANDAWPESIMSYFDQHENSYFANQGFTVNYVVTPMVADILAMQTLYGLSTTTRTGDTTYGYNSNAGGIYDATAYPKAAYTIFDSGGNDTIDYSGTAASQLINLNPETFSNVNGFTGNLSIARGVVIANAVGGNGADTIIGNSANNIITGNLGADTLTGGGGSDAFKDTKAGHSGDTIIDFSAVDRIVFSDATLGSFTFSLSGHTLTYTGGSLTLTNLPTGTLVASAAIGGGVQLAVAVTTTPPAHHAVHNDFNGDGRSDVLWRHDNGLVTDWLAQPNGLFAGNNALATLMDTGWHVAGTGDFNGDGRTDILWRHDNGLVIDWLGQTNGSFAGNAGLHTQVDSTWQIVGTGDFNGDGRSDVLWQSNVGAILDWLGQPDGTFAGNNQSFNTSFNSAWHVAGTGDFNGDGIDDILWRNNDGTVTGWLGQPDGTFVSNQPNLHTQVDSTWHIVGTGDFNGDGRSDVLWQSNYGAVLDWLGQADGTFVGNNQSFTTAFDSSWHVAETGDFNADAVDDILWHNNDGTVTEWFGQSNGAFVSNLQNLHTQMTTDWHVQPQAVFL
jgi:hypothetical protein